MYWCSWCIRSNPTAIAISNLVFVSAGHSHSILVTTTGQVYTCGLGTSGQLGVGSFSNFMSPQLTILSNIVFVNAGFETSFFINSTGSVFASGSNLAGIFGNGDNTGSNLPTLLTNPSLRSISKVSSNLNHALFLSTSGNAFSVGHNGFGQLGMGDNLNRSTPALVASNVIDVGTSNQTSFILFGNYSLYSFGKNDVSSFLNNF